ncbi:ATP-dependent nuclease [Candidatus Pantoea bituminis]|uniref:ATP-dependent nuclease n=1 Tax=Candidatus Pantoea bituminis TaxID=2831036 RepID=UPI00281138CF|nr:AAA family ATPase [Pantoea bituminis]
MAIIRNLQIENFRSVRYAEWYPEPGLNCLIGPGDSGKSTFLDAIDLVLGARRTYAFSDADFHDSNTANPIQIMVTLGALDDDLKNLETNGRYLRGFNAATHQINDEPLPTDEVVLTLKLTISEDLDPD